MKQIIVNVEGLSIEEKQRVNEANGNKLPSSTPKPG